jgi:iron complex outermembrane receptor protein
MSLGFAVSAQDATDTEDQGFEQITVTAQKRVERLSEVPVAVSVINSDQVDSAFSSSFESLQSLVPSVSFKKGTTSRNSAITIRGIGTISFSVAAEPSVSTVVDGVVLGRSGQAFTDLYDLERIEVLRGPQGTLFGKNASAGVVNITTKRPSGDTEGMFEATMFQDNEYRVKAKIQGAIGENAAGSLIVTKSAFDGNIFNVYNNEQVNGYDKQGFRAMLDVDVSEDSSLLFIFESAESNDDCCADIEGLPSNRNPDSAAAPNSDGSVNGVADLDLDQRLVDHDFESRTIDETTAFSVQFDTDFNDYSLTSITAYREWDNTEFREGDFTSIGGDSSFLQGLAVVDAAVLQAAEDARAAAALAGEDQVAAVNQVALGTQAVTFNYATNPPFQLHDVGPQNWKQFSQELRIASPVGEKLDWQAGAFYWQQESERSFTRDASCQFRGGSTIVNLDILLANPGLTCNADDIISATGFMRTKFNNWAVFADGKYHVSDDLRILFGLRYTDDEVSFNHRRVNHDPYGRQGVGVQPEKNNTPRSGETDEQNFSVKLGAQYDLGGAGMLYTTYSQGYKGPGFNVFYNMGANDSLPIAEETSDAYELGYKFASTNFMFNAAIFRTEIEGFQANNFDNSTGVTITRLTNAGNVSTEGFEFDFVWQATDDLRLTAGLAKIDAEIDEFFCPVGEACTDRSGLDVPFSPDLKYSLGADYVMALDDMDIIWNANYVYTDEQVATLPSNTGEFSPAVQLPDYALLNASVAFSFNDDAYRISLIAKNLTDEKYFTSYSGDGFRYQAPRDADRHFGVQLRVNF